MDTIHVQTMQVVIPHYRVPLYDRLAGLVDIDLVVHAGHKNPGVTALDSIEDLPYTNLHHEVKGILGTELFWQHSAQLAPCMQPGDVLVLNGDVRFLSNYPLILQAKRRGVGLVWWGHGFSRRHQWVNRVRWALLKHMDAVLLYTDAELSRYKDLGVVPDRLFSMNNGVDLETIDSAIGDWPEASLSEFRLRNCLDGEKLLLFCGRLAARGRVDMALRAVAELHAAGQSCRFVIIGDGPERETLQTLAVDLGISQNVLFLGAIYDERELAPWFLSADCLLHPGAIGLGLLHAMAYGVPTVTTDAANKHGPEIAALSVGENGLLFHEGSLSSLVEQVRFIMDNDSFRDRLSVCARNTVQTDYNVANSASRFHSCILYASEHSLNRVHVGKS